MPRVKQVKDKELLSEAFRIIGSRKTNKKASASRANGQLGGRPTKPLAEIPCTCGGGAVLTVEAHPTTCARGRAIRYRIKKGLVVE
jgi:hypothetical protein